MNDEKDVNMSEDKDEIDIIKIGKNFSQMEKY